jgi:hypothetical protein
MRYYSLILFILGLNPCFAQYPPAAGQPGSTAIHADSSVFIAWATQCDLERGSIDISDPEAAEASLGESSLALGKAGENGIVSLGDGGRATLTFEVPIADGPGWDFAVFENAFASGDGFFMELAFVEVSSDGITFFRFPASSLTQSIDQIGNFDILDPTKVNNLAGKYETLYGTPFNLEELPDNPNLNKQSITHVRIIDVVGSLEDDFASFDAVGQKINDPWPTPFPSCGFDLDAVGVIHNAQSTSVASSYFEQGLNLFPNPVKRGEPLNIIAPQGSVIKIYDYSGRFIFKTTATIFPTEQLAAGLYYFCIDNQRHLPSKLIILE